MAAVLERPRLVATGARPQDGVEDMTVISEIDEKGININLRVRYHRDQIYTYTGTILVAVNPYKLLPIYERESIEKYDGKKMTQVEPHVFATAEAAYYHLKHTAKNQSCVISGESGAGKTETTKFILQYLCEVTCSEAQWVQQQILEANTVLEAFGNAKTVRNDNSSRFGKFIQVCFDQTNQINGCIIQDYLLEQSRITFQAADERNYHIFYRLTAAGEAIPEIRDQFFLLPAKEYNYINQSGCYKLDDVDDVRMYEQTRLAFTVLNISLDMSDGIFCVLSAILYIGNLKFQDVDGESCDLTSADRNLTNKIATLLGIKNAEVDKVVTTRQLTVRGQVTDIPLKLNEARDNRHAMAKALYSRTFAWLVHQINSCTNPGANRQRFIGVLDIFGFENFKINSFEQLCINFTNEKLHKFFNHYVFALEQQIYKEEEINFSHIHFTDNTICLELIEKAPSCVLRMLDDECRFPKGTDQSYVEKQHAELNSHPNYVLPEDKRRHKIEFGIKHYAGPVMYNIQNFLEKNKDVQQDMLFDFMRHSKLAFVKEITKFQDILSAKLAMTRDLAVDKDKLTTGTQRKGKPTVGDTFKQQLVALVDVLDTTTPWYVRCLKPNPIKAAMTYDDELIITQLRYSGMLDIIRIRKEGFPVHVPAWSFLEKYRCLAGDDVLPKDEKQAVAHILRSLKVPETEWQIGKTKVFLRNSVFDPLEERRLKLLTTKIVLIQKVWRGYVKRKRFLIMRAAAIKVQSWYRGRRQRIWYVKRKRAIVVIQSHLRGFFARELFAALKEQKRREEEERQRKLRELEEKRRLEELAAAERRRLEAQEKAVQASMEAAQKELIALAQLAENKGKKLSKTKEGTVDLDQMFTFLAEAPKEVKETDYLATLNQELDAMFRESQPKPSERSRAGRRRQRIEKKLLILQEEDEAAKKVDDEIDPSQYDMLTFAEKWFNNHPKDTAGLGTFTMRRKRFTRQEAIPKADMIKYTKNPSMPTSLIHLHDPENVNLACTIWKDLCKLMRNELRPEQVNITIQNIIAYAIERVELRDEIFCQIMRQVTECPREDETDRGWHMLCLCCAAFAPGKSLNKFLQAFFKRHFTDEKWRRFAKWCLSTVCLTRVAPRKLPPSGMEIAAVKNLNPLICRFYFLDGKAKAVGVDPSATASDVLRALAEKIDLQSVDGWALYEVNPDFEHYIKGHEYIADILTQWDRDKRSSAAMSKYTTVSRKGHKEALGGGDSRFVFRKRVFRNPREIPQDPVEYHLMYAQATHSVVKLDEFPVNERVALQLAGLQLQVLWGDYVVGKDTRYNDAHMYLPSRILQDQSSRGEDEWGQLLAEAHREFGTGKTEIQAKVWYLTSVKHYPLYGSTFFQVTYKGFWSYPNNLILAIDLNGLKFVNSRSKTIMADFPFTRLESVSVDREDPVVILNMKVRNPEEQKCFIFETQQKEDIANLVASYSPLHSKWQHTGETKIRTYHMSEEDKLKLYDEVLSARRALAENNLLQRPVETSSGFLTTTLRKPSKEKLMRLKKQKENLPFDKVFKQSFWSYSKSRLSQPISIIISDELEDTACKMFYSLLIHAGIEKSGGFEMEGDENHVGMIQAVISKCLEKEALCNEFYLQLIKQTTDQPDPNSRLNGQNWRFMALICSIVVPRSKEILSYLMAHLRKCSIDSNTEEGKYAQFCVQCVQRTSQNKNRKYPPSAQEIMCVIHRRKIHARFYFMDGQFRALEFDSASTVDEVVSIVKERIGLRNDAQGFSLFEVFGQLERNMLSSEKVADAIYKWEKYAKSTASSRVLKLTFKKRLFLKPYLSMQDKVEFNLLFNQAIDDIVNDRFPLSYEEAVYLTALRAQVLLGPYADRQGGADYSSVIDRSLPKHMAKPMQPDDVARKHRELGSMGSDEANQTFYDFVRQWQLYGSTIFEVLQSYTATLPKNLWLAVNEQGIHIMKRRDKEPLVTYDYRNIVNYSPSLKNLMIVTESLTRGTKFVFNTSQASQIAHLIRDYTHVIVEKQRRAASRRR